MQPFMPPVEPVSLSVIICTRDRASQLKCCLQQFKEAERFCNCLELTVVDNNSSDETKSVTHEFAASVQFQVRYIFEGRQGLSHARNRGIAETSSSIIAFTDDDCLVNPQWASTIVREFSTDRSLAVLGGRVEPGNPNGQSGGTRTFSDRKQITSFQELFGRMIGCNMAFSRQVFEIIGRFDPLLGKGTSMGSAEDLDLMYRALKVNLPIVYVPEAVVFHAHGRTSMDSIQHATDDYARGRGAFYWKHALRGDLNIARPAVREIMNLTRAALRNGNRHGASPFPPRVLRNLAIGAFYRLRRL
jgi:GT2 family glycosyltransferase